jgi:hypothetical protein
MKSYLILLFLGFSFLIQSQSKPLLLHQYLKSESESILKYDHGDDWFTESEKAINNKIILQDFAKIKTLTSINIVNYKVQTFQEGKHLINIYKTNSKSKPYKIIEIITRDSYDYKGKNLSFGHIKYLILSKNNPKKVAIYISENGIDSYTIDGQRKYCMRESVIYIPEEFDNSAFYEVDSIMGKYKDK